MTEEEQERKAKVATIITDIQTGEEKKIIAGLKALKVHGDDDVILPVIDTWNAGISPKAEEAILTFLGDIKSTSSVQSIMDILLNEEYNEIHLPLLSTIWNSKVDYSDYLVDFVTLAVQYDFMVVLECLTVIENMDGPFEEHHLLDAELILREYAEKQQNESSDDEKKVQLIHEIAKLIGSFDGRA
jgi:hypothetical protein